MSKWEWATIKNVGRFAITVLSFSGRAVVVQPNTTKKVKMRLIDRRDSA